MRAVPHVADVTHFFVLSAIRSALPHDRPVEYLETGVWKGAASLLMSRSLFPTNVIGIDAFSTLTLRYEALWIRSSLAGEAGRVSWIMEHPNSVAALKSVRSRLKDKMLDMLLIAGESFTSSSRAVREIFAAYEPFVGSGGYIIFDDFMNSMSAAGVREAVWWMIDHGIIHHHKYEVIGTILNIAGAGCWAGGDCVFDWEHTLTSNEFIIRKL